jgi:hypothetical protein
MRFRLAEFLGALTGLLLLVAGACWFVGPPPPAEKPLWVLPAALAGSKATLPDLLRDRALATAVGIDEPAPVPGAIVVTTPPTRCFVPNPWPPQRQWLTPWQGLPPFPFANNFARCVVGKEFLLYWFTHNDTAVPGRASPSNAVLLVSLRSRELPEALEPIGMPGCWLQVHPDLALAPDGVLLRRDYSRLILRWTPPPELLGLSIRVQCVVEEPGVNQAGLLISPLVTFTIGNV